MAWVDLGKIERYGVVVVLVVDRSKKCVEKRVALSLPLFPAELFFVSLPDLIYFFSRAPPPSPSACRFDWRPFLSSRRLATNQCFWVIDLDVDVDVGWLVQG